tara:strand:- start:59 stop:1180 length:1122 start_codon:yes stop_codon:yes gene_type:complete
MKFLVVVGARPQFIKAAVVSKAISKRNITKSNKKNINEIILHTGQHFDESMSDSFFEDLEIPKPKYNLGLSSLSHGAMTGRMIEEIEKILVSEKPDCMIVFGDTNSTLAGAISASKLQIPIAHIESGLRSNNLYMPEEINRILTDRVSTFLFCSSHESIKNLKNEGFPLPMYNRDQLLFNFGDVMFDVIKVFKEKAIKKFPIHKRGFKKNNYVLATLHRPYLTDSPDNLKSAFEALQKISEDIEVVIPLHPRAKSMLNNFNLEYLLNGLQVLNPLSYLEMQSLMSSCKAVLTDSGGLQKEAMWHQKPCLTLRNDTEWKETVEMGWNILVGVDKNNILNAWNKLSVPNSDDIYCYGNGNAAELIVDQLLESIDS